MTPTILLQIVKKTDSVASVSLMEVSIMFLYSRALFFKHDVLNSRAVFLRTLNDLEIRIRIFIPGVNTVFSYLSGRLYCEYPVQTRVSWIFLSLFDVIVECRVSFRIKIWSKKNTGSFHIRTSTRKKNTSLFRSESRRRKKIWVNTHYKWDFVLFRLPSLFFQESIV